MTAEGPNIAGLPIGWGAVISLINLIVGGALVAWVKLRPKMRELNQTAEERLRDDLIARVEKLERKLDEERAHHDAIISLMRHRLNNSDQCVDALLMLLRTAPEKVTEAIATIEAMRERQRSNEATERAAIHAAAIVGTRGLAE